MVKSALQILLHGNMGNCSKMSVYRRLQLHIAVPGDVLLISLVSFILGQNVVTLVKTIYLLLIFYCALKLQSFCAQSTAFSLFLLVQYHSDLVLVNVSFKITLMFITA